MDTPLKPNCQRSQSQSSPRKKQKRSLGANRRKMKQVEKLQKNNEIIEINDFD